MEGRSREPTSVVLAGRTTRPPKLYRRLCGPNVRLYTNSDVLGVYLAASHENLIAIAAGRVPGFGLEQRTRCSADYSAASRKWCYYPWRWARSRQLERLADWAIWF